MLVYMDLVSEIKQLMYVLEVVTRVSGV